MLIFLLKHTKCPLALNPYTQVRQLSRSEWHKVEMSKEIVNHMKCLWSGKKVDV